MLQLHITIHIINKQGPTYSTGNYVQYYVITYNGKNLKNNIYIYIHIYSYMYTCVCICVCIYIYIWITLLYTWNIVKQVYLKNEICKNNLLINIISIYTISSYTSRNLLNVYGQGKWVILRHSDILFFENMCLKWKRNLCNKN